MEVLLKYTLLDGELRFAELPQRADWDEVAAHAAALPGVRLLDTAPAIEGGWMDFVCAGQQFRIRESEGGYWFFARDAACPQTLMRDLVAHFTSLLGTDLDAGVPE